jgi:hypothetical protein
MDDSLMQTIYGAFMTGNLVNPPGLRGQRIKRWLDFYRTSPDQRQPPLKNSYDINQITTPYKDTSQMDFIAGFCRALGGSCIISTHY